MRMDEQGGDGYPLSGGNLMLEMYFPQNDEDEDNDEDDGDGDDDDD